jgi:hypothetical protein
MDEHATNPATEQQAAAQQDAQKEQEGTELNISDLNSIKTIIDIASQRGAFKANELEAVGKTYNRLTNFLSQVAKGQ